MQFAIVTTCKGRLAHLKRALPTWLVQEDWPKDDLSIIIVDYGCPDGTADWCDALKDPRVRAVRAVNGVDEFNLSRARNIGAKMTDARFIAFVDADMLLSPDFIRSHVDKHLADGCEIISDGPEENGVRAMGALCTMERTLFESMRGFDESFRGYGHEDTDFRWRSVHAGARLEWMLSKADHIACTDEERTRFYADKDIAATIERNFKQLADPFRIVNAEGWGIDSGAHG